jgi:hypothetical protein
MSRDDLAVDDSAASLARKVSRESIATLIAVSRDPHAPASARAQCATKLLEIGHGRPAFAKAMTVADLSAMTPELRQQLFEALWCHFEVELPAQFRAMIVDQAMALHQAHLAALPKPQPKPKPKNRFTRQAPEPPADKGGAAAIRSDLSAKSVAPGGDMPETARPPLSAPPSGGGGDGRVIRPNNAPSNIVVMPGVSREAAFAESSANARPPPYGLRYGLAEHLEATLDATPSNGGVYPSVVRRSQLKDPWGGR